MKPDDFEQQLQRQPLRAVPAAWRKDVLERAAAAARPERRHPSAPARDAVKVWWREWLWPCPEAWAGLAAVWMAILLLNYGSHEEPVTTAAQPAIQPANPLQALHERREMLRAELTASSGGDTAEAVEPFRPRPRSHRAVPGTAAAV